MLAINRKEPTHRRVSSFYFIVLPKTLERNLVTYSQHDDAVLSAV